MRPPSTALIQHVSIKIPNTVENDFGQHHSFFILSLLLWQTLYQCITINMDYEIILASNLSSIIPSVATFQIIYLYLTFRIIKEITDNPQHSLDQSLFIIALSVNLYSQRNRIDKQNIPYIHSSNMLYTMMKRLSIFICHCYKYEKDVLVTVIHISIDR